jgi:hypothetical protein
VAAWAVAFAISSQTRAVERVYTILPGETSIAISGSVRTSAGSAPIQPQGQGSLTSNYTGTIRTDRGDGTIQFLAGSSIDASVTGNWQPLPTGASGSAPADYGGRVSFLFGLVTINFAARDFVGDFSSGVLPLDADGDFDLSTTTVRFLDGDLAFRVSTGDFGAESIAGESGMMAGSGSLTTALAPVGMLETLSIPINSSFVIPVGETTTVTLELTGELVANATLSSRPGDFNRDGNIDAADYVVWRNDPSVGEYETWRANYGRPANGSSVTAVPEPAAVRLAFTVVLMLVGCRARNGCAAPVGTISGLRHRHDQPHDDGHERCGE